MANTHVDVLIVGAGVSGIAAACHLRRQVPNLSYLVLEQRDAIGGTWDLFRYPGIRSDSDMFTFGFNFRPWTGTQILADGPSIRAYLEETASEYGVTEHIRFGREVIAADFATPEQRWSVRARNAATGRTETYTADFVIAATGYYDYAGGYRPAFPGEERFSGPIVHPQHWPADLDYRGKRVVVIGSGATAVTLVPAMAPDAEHVVMLQRSPSYIITLPSEDKMIAAARRVMPDAMAYRLGRGRNILLQRALYAVSRAQPGLVRSVILTAARRQVGPSFDPRDFTPRYGPWDERLCVVPDGDLFKALRHGRAEIVTDEIDTFTETGIRLRSGRELPADIVISATGLKLRLAGADVLTVDGESVDLANRVTYKSVLVEGVPNAAMIFGYTNASWTLKADLACEYVCRILRHMRAHGYTQVVAHATDADRTTESAMGSLNSGYVKRAEAVLPRQGVRAPWRVLNNYLRDAPQLRYRPLEDGVLQFSRATEPAQTLDALVG